MTEKFTADDERVDDIPLLMAHMERMGIPALLDEQFPTHGNWEGLSLGWVATGWLAHILSQADHRMNYVQGWAAKRLQTLQFCTGEPVRELDFADDRLAGVLRHLSDDEQWDAFENALNGHLLRVYPLLPDTVRIDTTTASGYWRVTSEGLFQFGYSKDHRPDLPQVKVVLAAMDPLGMPLAADVVAGNCADDPLYIPSIKRVRESLGRAGLLYVGDSKMGALGTRAFVERNHDYYLTPLSRVQLPEEERGKYLEPILNGDQSLTPIYRETKDGEQELIAQGCERTVTLTAEVDGEDVTWEERRLIVRSLKQARSAERRLRRKLERAQADLEALNARGRGKKRYQSIAELRQAAESIVEDYDVEGLLSLNFYVTFHRRQVRGYGDRPTRVEVRREPRIVVSVNPIAVRETIRRLGWIVYATNAFQGYLPLGKAVLAYRDQYIVERSCGCLKGAPLSLTPMYVERDDHATGLVRLLTIGMRVLTLLEFVVRHRLAEEEAELAGLYAGNPARTTSRPTAELLLGAFDHITLMIIEEPHRTLCHITPLSHLQLRILELLDLPPTIYTQLAAESPKPP
jgi:transposase